MGIYLNPGCRRFQMALDSEIYVDKTGMMRCLNAVVNTNQRFVSVSRPRRFGKTMAADMLCAYYGKAARNGGNSGADSESRSLFEKTKLSSHAGWDRYLGKFDVIRLVMTRFFKSGTSAQDALGKMQKLVIREMRSAFPDVEFLDQDDLIQSMEDVYASTGKQFALVIDEWDAVFRECPEDTEGQTLYLDFLRNWMKDNEAVALAYMTGILPIKKYGKHSALNMFDEYSMTFPMELAQYTGFTESEVRTLCRRYGRDFDALRAWYDGYEVSDIIPPDPDRQRLLETGKPQMPHRHALYSPLSVVNAVHTGHIKNYWNDTETYEALAGYIRRDFDGLKQAVALLMDGGRLPVDLSTYQNDMTTFHGKDDVLALLIHLGYLGYDDRTSRVFIPNKEILEEFQASTKSPEWSDAFRAFEKSVEMLEATWRKDAGTVARLAEEAHDRSENKTYNNEAALSYAIQLAYYAAQKYYTTIQELDTGKGYADIVYLPAPQYPEKPALLIELKYDKDAETALTQIRNRHYPQVLNHYKGNILLVGINYVREVPANAPGYKHHACVIEDG